MSKPKRILKINDSTSQAIAKTAKRKVSLPATTPSSKLDTVIALLRRPKGATLEELMEATGWQRHSVHGTLSGTIKKKRGLPLITEFSDHGRRYRIGTR